MPHIGPSTSTENSRCIAAATRNTTRCLGTTDGLTRDSGPRVLTHRPESTKCAKQGLRRQRCATDHSSILRFRQSVVTMATRPGYELLLRIARDVRCALPTQSQQRRLGEIHRCGAPLGDAARPLRIVVGELGPVTAFELMPASLGLCWVLVTKPRLATIRANQAPVLCAVNCAPFSALSLTTSRRAQSGTRGPSRNRHRATRSPSTHARHGERVFSAARRSSGVCRNPSTSRPRTERARALELNQPPSHRRKCL